MSAPITQIKPPLAESSDYLYAPTEPLSYIDGTPVLTSHISSFTVKLVDVLSQTELYNGDFFDGGGEIDSSGMLTFPLSEVHTAAIGSQEYQERRLTFVVTTSTGFTLRWQINFWIINLIDG